MKRAIQSQGFVLIITFFVLGLSGCEQVKGIQEYFNKKSTKKVETTKTAPVESVLPQTAAVNTPLPQNVLARVGQWSITKEDFDKRLENFKQAAPEYDTTATESRRMLLDELINQQVLSVEAAKKGLDNNPDIQEALVEFKKTLMIQEFVKQTVESVNVSEDEAKALYNERKEMFIEPIELRVREIVVDSQDKANQVLVEILKGADFAEMAKQNSKAKTAAQGGDLGFIANVPFPEMGSVLMALDVGGVSNVFKGPEGFYIVKVEEKKGGAQLEFEKIKDAIVQNLKMAKQQQIVLDLIGRLRQEQKVEINQNLLK